jgi:hypothetical protein
MEDRLVPSINVLFDFRYDTGFFTNHPDRITTIRAAAADVGSRFTDTLAAITYPTTPGDFWEAKFDRPGGVGQPEEIQNLLVPANTIVVFVGSRGLSGTQTVESSDRAVSGGFDFSNLVLGRGQPSSYSAGATDFSPWGGSITFDSLTNWHFGLDQSIGSNEIDLFMATEKALFHILGFGASEAWNRLAANEQFNGPHAVGAYGSPVPLTSGQYEWVEDTLSQGQRTLMDANLEDGERILPTALDLAAMQDIGWTPTGTSPPPVSPPPTSPPPPPAAASPPVAPPAPIPTGTDLSVVGTGPGATARINLNDAETFTQLATFTPYAGLAGGGEFTGGVRAITADIDKDGVEDVIVGPGPGIPTEVKVYSGKNFPVSPETSLFASGYAFETSFTGGVFLSAGDFNGDGYPDIVVSPDEGGGPRVRIVSGKDRTLLADFFGIDDPNFRGGARTAVGDVNGDGTPDLVVAAGFGGGPRVAIFDGKSIGPGLTPRKLVNDFFVFEQTLRNGAYVAVGDIDGDGFADLIAGGGPGGGPRVLAYSGHDLTQQSGTFTVVANFFAGDTNSRGGVPVAVKNIDGDNHADIVTGAGQGSQSVVTTYLGSSIQPTGGTPPVYQEYLVFDASFLGGVYVG